MYSCGNMYGNFSLKCPYPCAFKKVHRREINFPFLSSKCYYVLFHFFECSKIKQLRIFSQSLTL